MNKGHVSVSIIIPSAGRRPKLLQRAIKSALIDSEQIQTEIIVVLNGIDGMAFDTSLSFQHPLVSYHKLEQGNVSKARNYGLSLAHGELIRYLDDDDYLYSEIANQQYMKLFASDADLSTFNAEIIDQDTQSYGSLLSQKYTHGLDALLAGEMIGITFIHVYKKHLLLNLKWNEKNSNGEDFEWLFTVLLNKKCRWIYDNQIVGVWFQHKGDRLSPPLPVNFALRLNVENMIKTYEYYNFTSQFLAVGIWHYSHIGFYLSPIYWTKVSLYARKLSPNSKPNDSSFQKIPDWIHPLIVEWLMLPKRWFNHLFRILKLKLGYNSYVRKI